MQLNTLRKQLWLLNNNLRGGGTGPTGCIHMCTSYDINFHKLSREKRILEIKPQTTKLDSYKKKLLFLNSNYGNCLGIRYIYFRLRPKIEVFRPSASSKGRRWKAPSFPPLHLWQLTQTWCKLGWLHSPKRIRISKLIQCQFRGDQSFTMRYRTSYIFLSS